MIFLLFPIHVHAEESAFSVSPQTASIYSKPDQTLRVDFTLKNLGDPLIFSYSILPFEPEDVKGSLSLKPNMSGIIDFDPSDQAFDEPFLLKTAEAKKISLQINISPSTPEGDYYFGLVTKTNPAWSGEGNTVSRARLGMVNHILLTVSKNGQLEIKPAVNLFEIISRYQITIGKFKIKINDASDPLQAVLSIQNKGKNRFLSSGFITVDGLFGSKKYEFKPEEVLAKSGRILKTGYPSDDPTALSLRIPGLFFGIYRLSTTVTFGSGTPSVFASTWLMIVPLKLMFVLGLFGAIIAFFFLKMIYKKSVR